MTLEQAAKILAIHYYNLMGYARDLSYDPTRKEVAQTIETVLRKLNELTDKEGTA